MPVYRFEGYTPVVDPSTFLHPTAVLIGDVVIGPHCYIGPGASLRGDFGRILVGPGANIQDNCILHTFPGVDVVLEEDAHIGHGAVLHGCVVRRGALVGISAVVMDGVVVGEESFVGASSFVKAGFEVPARTLVTGVPARVVRELGAKELAWKANGTRAYQELAVRCLQSFAECEPLPAVERGRPAPKAPDSVPLHQIERNRNS